MAHLAECFLTAISVQKAVEGIKPKVFQVSIGSCNTVEGLDVDFRMSVEILFDESLNFLGDRVTCFGACWTFYGELARDSVECERICRNVKM